MQKNAFYPGRPLPWLPPKLLRIVKIIILIMTACLMQVSAASLGQNISLSEKNAPLKEVLKKIRAQSGVNFLYADDLFKEAKTVSIQFKNIPLTEALDKVFENQPLAYKFKENTVVVKLKTPSFLDQLVNGWRAADVHCKVVDEKDQPLPGASVKVKGTNKGTTTDDKGEFTLRRVDEQAVLVISYLGYKTREIPVKDIEGMTEIKMELGAGELEEVNIMVNTGYQQLPKERATGSFYTVDKKAYDSRVSTDVISRLEGITSGLVFNRDGYNNNVLSIRGRSTIFANTEPLIVVDNFPYDGDINNINPNDIENITILKDAAAASIWGVRAGNGVIVITTKKGKFNQPLDIQFNANVSIGDKPDLFYSRNFLPAPDYIEVEKTLFSRGYFDADINNTSGTFPALSPVVEILAKQRAGTISSADAENQINAFKSIDKRTELSKYFYRKSVNQQYNLNLNGGSEKHSYAVSVGYDNNLQNQVGSNNNRITVNAVNTFRPIKNLEFSLGVNYVQQGSKVDNTLTGQFVGRAYNYPYLQIADQNGTALPYNYKYNNAFVNNAQANGFLDWSFKPLDELNGNYNTSNMKLNDTRLNGNVKYTLFKGLTAEINYQYEKGLTQNQTLQTQDSYYVRDMINRYASVSNGVVTRGDNIPFGGILEKDLTDLISQTGRGQLNYNNTIGKHGINAIAGFEVRDVRVNGSKSGLYGYNDVNGTYQVVDLVHGFPTYPDGGYSNIPNYIRVIGTLDRFRSYFSNIAYTYNNKYTLSGSARFDQSNLFGVNTNQKGVPLWSVGGKWRIDQEAFYKVDWLPELSFRATYGYNGNLNKSVAAYTRLTVGSAVDVNGPYIAAQIYSLGNPDLRWEKIAIMNLGLDFGLKNNLLNGSIEYFNKKGKDVIGDTPVPPSTGLASFIGNYSNISGQGVDVSLTSQIIDKMIKWRSSLLFSYATDRVTKYNSLNFTTPGVRDTYPTIEGRPVEGIYSLPWAGLDPLTGDPRGYLDGIISKNYISITSSPISKWIYNGPANPVFSGGWRNTVSYKKLTLSVNLSYKLGYYFKRASIDYNGILSSGDLDYFDRWQKQGDEKRTNIPSFPIALNDAARNNFYRLSEVLVERGDHIRIQDVNLSYDLNKDITKKFPFKTVQFYANISNVGILWRANKYGIDPDQSTYAGNPPSPRMYTIGIKARI